MLNFQFQLLLITLLITFGCTNQPKNKSDTCNTFKVNNPAELRDFFSYSTDRIPFICAHRGGDRKYFPENCLATFENTLREVHAMIETDPRYTKDSLIVLMHDPTLDRTTNGTGRVCDFTLEELKKLRLKDSYGNVTDYQIPTLAEALEWSKSKTILVLDRKDVPIETRIKMIEEHKAESHAIVIAYSIDEIKESYRINPDIIMEIMLADTTQVNKFDKTGVPWENIVGFVSHSLIENPEIFKVIHTKGTMCIVGSSRNHDLSYKKGEIKSIEELSPKYIKMITDGADIIEADLAIEAGLSIKNLVPVKKSISKGKFFSNNRFPSK